MLRQGPGLPVVHSAGPGPRLEDDHRLAGEALQARSRNHRGLQKTRGLRSYRRSVPKEGLQTWEKHLSEDNNLRDSYFN